MKPIYIFIGCLLITTLVSSTSNGETKYTQVDYHLWDMHGQCPYCDYEQDFKLAQPVKNVGGFLTMLARVAAETWKNPADYIEYMDDQISGDRLRWSPAIKCANCKRVFVECPYCHATNPLEAKPGGRYVFQNVNCITCNKMLYVSDMYTSTTGYNYLTDLSDTAGKFVRAGGKNNKVSSKNAHDAWLKKYKTPHL